MVGPGRHLASLRHCHKAKYQSQLIPKDDMRVSLSTTVPRISDIVRRKQTQKSQ